MSRIFIDPVELAGLSTLCRNASYDAAGIATEAAQRSEHLTQLIGTDAGAINALVDHAIAVLQRVAVDLDNDALALAMLGGHDADAASLGELAGNEHALMTRFDVSGEDA